jgi:hypothetical protein
MSKLENLWWNIAGSLATIIVISVIEAITGFFQKLNMDTKLFIIALLLLSVIIACIRIIYDLHKYEYPRNPKLIKSHTEPDTYIFIRGRWRRIPDWQTRDYLATVLDFRSGEEDIKLESKDYVDKLSKGAPLESVFTYSKK